MVSYHTKAPHIDWMCMTGASFYLRSEAPVRNIEALVDLARIIFQIEGQIEVADLNFYLQAIGAASHVIVQSSLLVTFCHLYDPNGIKGYIPVNDSPLVYFL